MNTYIYALIDPRDEKIKYVGKSNNPKKRLPGHYHAYKPTIKYYWLHKLRRLGLKPELIILDEIDINDWQFWETYWYWQVKSWGYELKNSDLPGKGGFFLSVEQRKNINRPTKGKKLVDCYGKEKAENIGKKISYYKNSLSKDEKTIIANKARDTINLTPGLRESINKNISEARLGATISELQKEKISNGIKNSKKYKTGINNRRTYNAEDNPNYKGKIYQYDKNKNLIKIWEGLHELKIAGFNIGNVSSVCNGKLKTTQGYYWNRIDLSIDF